MGTVLTGATVAAGMFGGLWLLTGVARVAAYAMFALAWSGWQAVRGAALVAGALPALWRLAFGAPAEQVRMRRPGRDARVRDRDVGRLRPA